MSKSKSEPKKQHFVPNGSYLAGFVDPNTPQGQKPYVWLFSKDGKKKYPNTPDKLFRVKHLYTRKSQGQKDYSIETTLSQIEGQYATIFREKIKKRLPLNDVEHIMLCAFVSTMLFRTVSQKENIEGFLDELIEMTEAMERQHGVPPKKSLEIRAAKENAHKEGVLNKLPDIADILYQMDVAFLCSDSERHKFITSDDPCSLFNPDLQWQKVYGPGLLQNKVQLTMPLSPEITVCFSWQNLKGYINIEGSRVEDLNRLTRFQCHEHFVSSRPKKNFIWFLKFPISFAFLLKVFRERILKQKND